MLEERLEKSCGHANVTLTTLLINMCLNVGKKLNYQSSSAGDDPAPSLCWCPCVRMMAWRLTGNPNHTQIALFCFFLLQNGCWLFGEDLDFHGFACSHMTATVVNNKPNMRTISNSLHRTLGRTSISATTPNAQIISSSYRLWHFLNSYMWSGLPILHTDVFNTFKGGIIHSFVATDLASSRFIRFQAKFIKEKKKKLFSSLKSKILGITQSQSLYFVRTLQTGQIPRCKRTGQTRADYNYCFFCEISLCSRNLPTFA